MKNDREVMQALLDGETLVNEAGIEWVINEDGNVSKMHNFPPYWFLKIKPKTININGFDVPIPARELSIGDIYYIVDFTTGIMKCEFENSDFDLKFINLGICHSTLGAAKIHCAALLSFTKDK